MARKPSPSNSVSDWLKKISPGSDLDASLEEAEFDHASELDLIGMEFVKEEARDFGTDRERDRHDADMRDRDIDHKGKSQNISARRTYARCIFALLVVWVSAVMATVIGSGLSHCPLELSDSVLIALIAGSSVNIIGLFAVVANYLFPANG